MDINKYKWLGSALCLALMLVTASCSMHDDISDDCGRSDGKQQVYVKLRLIVPSQNQGTRAKDPAGGEENGEGREEGQSYENSITSALVFFYRSADGINSDASTPIDEYAYMTVTEGVTNVMQIELELDTEYNVLVVANPGDYSWVSTEEGRNLGGVRNHICTQAWGGNDDEDYRDFVMSSEDGREKITVTDENTSEATPATVDVTVERLAARVDYKTNQENNYPCGDALGSVNITGAVIINQLSAGTYLIKRVTPGDDINADVVYLGDEEPATGGMATNYVIDPWTLDKNAANAVLSDGNNNFELPNGQMVNAAGLYNPETYFQTIPDGTNPETWAGYCEEGTDMVGEGDGWKRIGYTLENTTSAENTSTNYNTGIVFKAQFHPAGIGYTDGHTFFRYNTTIYTTLTGMMASLNNKQDFAQYVTAAVADFTDWSDVTAFANSLTDPTGYNAYLSELATSGEDFSLDAIPDWNEYMLKVLGVDESSSDNGPQINLGGINTREVLFTNSSERLRTYYHGQCYYIWWLRHSNNDDDTSNGVMEYAVVRNNIYKVTVNSVSTIGGDIPGEEELRAHVYVNDWVALGDETLPM